MMEKHNYGWALIVSFIIILGSISFTLCFAAEFKKSKKRDLRLDGRFCYLPESEAFGLGIAALVLLFIAQISGNLLICKELYTKSERQRNCEAKRPIIVIISLILSWISFGAAFVLIGAGTSMNRRQEFGEGWLDGECYLVKDGVYIGSSILVLFTLVSIVSSAIISSGRRKQDEQGTKVHAQEPE